jgi:hypothetical protein
MKRASRPPRNGPVDHVPGAELHSSSPSDALRSRCIRLLCARQVLQTPNPTRRPMLLLLRLPRCGKLLVELHGEPPKGRTGISPQIFRACTLAAIRRKESLGRAKRALQSPKSKDPPSACRATSQILPRSGVINADARHTCGNAIYPW